MSFRQFHDCPKHNFDWKINYLQILSDESRVYEPTQYEGSVDKEYYAVFNLLPAESIKVIQYTLLGSMP